MGYIPFIKGNVLYPWSKLNPYQVKLSVAVMPDCQHLLEKDLITDPPPEQGPVYTVFAPKSFRYLHHNLLSFICFCSTEFENFKVSKLQKPIKPKNSISK